MSSRFQQAQARDAVKKHETKRILQEALDGQLKEKPIHEPKKEHSAEMVNPFARSESQFLQERRDKAKQIYLEQSPFVDATICTDSFVVEVLKWKRQAERQAKEKAKLHSLERLEWVRHELDRDLKQIKHSKSEARRTLEVH